MKMDSNESVTSNEKEDEVQQEQQDPEQRLKKASAWIARAINAGVIGGSESNIKQLRNLKKPELQHKSDVLIAKHKNEVRKNVVSNAMKLFKRPDYDTLETYGWEYT